MSTPSREITAMSTDQSADFFKWAKSLEESNAGVLPETGLPLVSQTEWTRLEDFAVRKSIGRRSMGISMRILPSVFARLI